MNKWIHIFIAAFAFLVSSSALYANEWEQIYSPTTEECENISSITVRFQEAIASNIGAQISSVTFIRGIKAVAGCWIVVDSNRGPHTCQYFYVYQRQSDGLIRAHSTGASCTAR